jgi:hypothetical protein
MAFAALAIIGVLPIGLSTSHSAQDETRASQIAEDVFSTFASQAQTQFTAVVLPVAAPTIDLTSSNSPITNPAAFFYADNSGTLSNSAANAAYSISIGTNTAPGGFDTAFANAVTVRVVSPPLSNQTATAKQGQTARDYQRVISKY